MEPASTSYNLTKPSMRNEIRQCRICANQDLRGILSLGDQALTGLFPRTAQESVNRGLLELVKCHGENACGLVQLRHSFDSSEMYGENYGYRSSLNQSMVRHLQSKVALLMQLQPLAAGDVVLDVGSNDGTLLSFYPQECLRVGMDPTAAKFRHYYQPGIEIVTDFFSAEAFRGRVGKKKVKILTSIAMFYDLEDPLSFVEEVAAVLADDGIWHFEQSYLPTMLALNAYDTICHEHLEYYALRQIQWLVEKCGLRILNVELNDVNGGSFAVTVAKANSAHRGNSDVVARALDLEQAAGLETMKPYEEFKVRIFKHREQLIALLDKLASKGAKVLGYGASTKGNVLLQFCGITAARVPFIAEVNSDKFGCVTPGSKIPIISEDEARALNPDYFLVMPWHFRRNLLQREAAYLASGGKMIFPLPEIEVIGE